MRAFRFVVLPISVLSLVAVGAGCTGLALAAGAAAGAAAVVYIQGDLETTLDAAPPQVAVAAENAFEDLDLPLVSSKISGLDGRIEAKTAKDTQVVIDLDGLDDGRTRTAIRVGTFGDEALSRRILDRIHEHLGDGGRRLPET